MDEILAIAVLITSLLILDRSSRITITNSIKVSDITGLSRMSVGFILLAFSTSLPELSVAIIASLAGDAPLSVGNVLGSNIVNICLIIGLATFLIAFGRRGSRVIDSKFAKEELGSLYFGLLVASIVPLFLIYLAGANWIAGLVLVLVFAAYTYRLLKIRIPAKEIEGVSDGIRRKLRLYTALTFLGSAGVVASAYFIVESAVVLADFAGVPRTIIGATIIAVGTSLPEISTSIKAFSEGYPGVALGNIVGSCFINITLILGITLLVPALVSQPLNMNMRAFLDLVIFSIIANVLLWYFLSRGRIGRREGAILLSVYLLFLASSLGLVQLGV